MQVCTLLQTENHTSTPPLFLQEAGCPSCRPTNSIKALKAVVYPTTAEYCDLQLFSKAHDQSFSTAGP